MRLTRDTLFIIKAPFEDAALDGTWFCASCATMEGALLANPHWATHIDVKRMPFPRPQSRVSYTFPRSRACSAEGRMLAIAA